MLFLCRKWLPQGPHNWTASLSWKSHSQSRLLTKSGPEYKPLSSMHWPPLHPLLETDSKGETITHDQALEAAVTAVLLLGNASAQITHVWRTKVLTHLNKSLLPLLEENDNFKDAVPSLFGPEFARKSKELIDQVEAIRSTTQKDGKSFFDNTPPRAGG